MIGGAGKTRYGKPMLRGVSAMGASACRKPDARSRISGGNECLGARAAGMFATLRALLTAVGNAPSDTDDECDGTKDSAPHY